MKTRKIIKNNDTILYQSRKGQFGHITLDQFKQELKKEHKSFDLRKQKIKS